jgi:serine/threonine-protein kinase
MISLKASKAIYSAYVRSVLCRRAGESRTLGQYRLREKIGSGGMGEVWKAEHAMLARPAVVKLIRPDLVDSNKREKACLLKRFEREARATALLQSPHTVDVYDYGIAEDETFYYVMEFLEGVNLETLIERFGPVSAERAAYLLTQVCGSLAEAHQFGLIHRDLKPSNIFVCRLGLEYDFVKILDFGLVKQLQTDHTRLTRSGVVAGTPAFLAPEVALDGGRADARSDIYALGCVAYWLVTGRLVFESETPIGTILQHVQTSPIPPSRRCEINVPEALERIILSCLEKDPSDRPQTAQELRCRLAGCKLRRDWDAETAENWWSTVRIIDRRSSSF